MRGKILTPIGFMIDLLGVSIKDMAEKLYVDRTTICKWKADDRHFSVKSDYFDKVVDYFLVQNNIYKRNILENLFSSLYGEVPYRTKDYLKNSMEKFLTNSVVPMDAQNMLSQMKGSLYSTMTGIYAGIDGRRCAMNMLLTEAENKEKPSKLIFFDRQTFSWCLYDEKFFREWYGRIKKLLELKWDISFILDCSSSMSETLSVFLNLMRPLYVFPNYHEFNFNSVKNINLLPTVYGLKGGMALFGYNHGKQVYTSVFKDKFTVSQGYEYLNNLISECEVTFVPKNQKERIELLQRIIKYESYDEHCYLASTRPSIITLGEDMILQILKDNDVYGELKSNAMKTFSAILKSALESKSVYRHLLYYSQLSSSVQFDKMLFHEATSILGREIYITNVQYREHLRRTADFILTHENYAIAFVNYSEPLPSPSYCFRCKNKLYAVGIGDVIRFNAESSIVNSTFSMCDKAWSKLPNESIDKEIISKRLLEIANS